MIEVEIKIKIKDPDSLPERLMVLGFVRGRSVVEEDTYFDNGSGQIAGGHQALRIRKILEQDGQVTIYQVNFKDKKLDQVSMTRPEYETEVSDGAAFAHILNGMGFFAVEPRVRKERTYYRLDQVTACFDLVDGLGYFLELEQVISESEDREEAFAQLEQILNQLGLRLEDSTNRSYLSQLRTLRD